MTAVSPPVPQACHIVGGATGLIPSHFLEEKRKAFVRRDWDGSGTLQAAPACGTPPQTPPPPRPSATRQPNPESEAYYPQDAKIFQK